MAKNTDQSSPQTSDKAETRAALRTRVAEAAVKRIEIWDQFARKRLNQIREYELSYYGNVRPNLKGRSNFPFPVLAKYVDELKGRLDDLPAFRLENNTRKAQALVVKKASAALDKLKKPQKGDWARNDRMGRINSIFSGYAAYDSYTEVDDGTFKACVKPIDHNDFIFDPLHGSELEEHSIVGKLGIFRSAGQLDAMAESGVYDKDQVRRLKNRTADSKMLENAKMFTARYDRYKAMGLDVENNTYTGEPIYMLATVQMEFEGERYYVTLDPVTRIAVRFEKLKKVFESGLYSVTLYQTHEDPNVVMCKAPVDDIFPIAEGMRVKVNQTFDASTKDLWGMKVVDPNFFPDPSMLEWRRPDQIVIGRSYQGKPMSSGIYEPKTSFNFDGNLNFVKWLDDFLAGVVGINPGDISQDKEKVGILFGQLQKQGARLGVQNKSYSEMWSKAILRILHGMKENMTEPMMVKMIGSMGIEWVEFAAKELGNPDDFDIVVEGSSVEAEMNEALAQRKQKALDEIKNDPDLKKEVSPRWLVEQYLKQGRWSEEDIVRAMDIQNYGSEESICRADMAIEEILKGKEPKIYKGADAVFYEYLYNYAMKLDDSDPDILKQKMAIIYYGKAHLDIVVKNAALKASVMSALKTPAPDAGGGAGGDKLPADGGAGGDMGGGAKVPVKPRTGANPVPSAGIVPAHIVARNRTAFPPSRIPAPPAPPMPGGFQ